MRSRNARGIDAAEKYQEPDEEHAAARDTLETSPRPKSERSERAALKTPDEDLDVWIHSQFYARGGQKKKALQALSRHQTGISVHQVPEVRKINSSTNRLGVKLEYYRDHTEAVESLMRVVEEGFMCQESSSGEPLVNVAKVRSRGLKVTETDLLDVNGARPRSQASRASRSPGSRPWTPRALLTPELKITAEQQRSSAHSARLRDAVQRAREIHTERRLEHAFRLRLQQTRHERAQRERPWITILVVALSSMLLRKLVTVHRQVRQAICGDHQGIDQTQVIRVYRDDFRQICREQGADLSLFTPRQFQVVQADVARLCDLELQRRRSHLIWTAWKKLLRLLVVPWGHDYIPL